MPKTQATTEFERLPPIAERATRYEVLGVSRGASPEEIRVAYRRLALLYHPDRHPEADRTRAGEVFKQIASAYGTLSNPAERRRYDAALDRGENFHEAAGNEAPVTLADILAGIDAYEHIFSAEKLSKMNPALRDIVMPRLLTDVHEQIVGVWKMPAAPAGVTHSGTYNAGAVVLTNLRVLLPYTFSWEETSGNTKTRYRGAGMPSFVLPLVKGITIISRKRVRNSIWVEIRSEQGATTFRPGHRNLGKLLLIARLWGIAVEARQEEMKMAEWQWAILRPWMWAAGALAGGIVLAAAAGIFWGGILDNPINLVQYMSQTGLWQWYVVAWAGMSALRIWRLVKAYDLVPPVPADDSRPETMPGVAREEHATAG